MKVTPRAMLASQLRADGDTAGPWSAQEAGNGRRV